VTQNSLTVLYEYLQAESQRNENALTVAVNNFMMCRKFDKEKANELMSLVDRKEYFDKVRQDILTCIEIMQSRL